MTKLEFSRLPTSIVPSNYKLHLIPDLVNFTFKGECEVTGVVTEETSSVVCNASNLEVEDASVLTNGVEVKGSINLNQKDEELTLKLEKPLTVGPVVIRYKFTGILNDKMRGFYRSKYMINGESRHLAVTQFESTDARQAFPCWDEPAVKATFDLTVTGPKDNNILSNMPETSVKEEGETKTITFNTTPIMSTYLLAIVVGQFDYLEDSTSDGVKVRVFTPLGKKDQGQFALECAVKSLSFYNEFFGIPYPLEKYDMVAIPDFSAGAMENWGLVTYREVCILVDSVNTSAATKERIAIIVCHEAAHQWFGNLVTMEWWTHLWLNEGFASFMENLTTDALYPEFKIWDQFIPGTLVNALKLDALSSSHAIEVAVGHPSEVDEIFDNISYNKGASIIRMLYNWIGDSHFKTGMHNYLKKYSYQNAETPQLWAELESASGLPVNNVMKTWTNQMGFPVISVSSRQEGPDRILSLSQSKFVSTVGNLDTSSYMWQVPVSILRGDNNQTLQVMMDQKTMEFKIPNLAADQFFKLNPGFVGFYRVQYSAEDLDRLCTAVSSKVLPSLDRFNILDDVFSLISAGKANTADGLRLMQAYKSEDSYVVWNNICTTISSLDTLLADQEYYCNYKRFCLDIFSEIKNKVVWDEVEGNDHLDTLLRSLVLTMLGKFGDEGVREEAKRRFDKLADGTGLAKADIRSTIYCCTAARGDASDFDAMVKLYRASDMDEEKSRLRTAGLANFSKKELLQRSLDFAISDDVRAQDSVFLIASVARNRLGRDLAWEFFKEKQSMLKERYESGFLLSCLVKSVSERFLTEDMAKTVELYFEAHQMPGSERNVSQAVETIRLNAAWLTRDAAAIKTVLTEF